MRYRFSLKVHAPAVVMAALATFGIVETPAYADVFPTIEARTLNKDRFTVPVDFTKPRNILLVSMDQGLEDAIDAWDAALEPLRASSDGVEVYNTPLIKKPGALIRGFINGGFRGIYKEDEVRDRVIILYLEDQDAVFASLEVKEEDKSAPMIFVTDQAGEILGRVPGPATPENVAAVTALAAVP